MLQHNKASAARRDDLGTLVDRMVASLWAAVAAGDLLRAELEAATCMALPRVGRLAPEDVQAFIDESAKKHATMERGQA